MDLSRLVAALDDESTEATVVVRTDFSDDAAWSAVIEAVSQPIPDLDDDFGGNFVPIDEPTLDGLTVETLTADLEPLGVTAYVILADARSMSEARSGQVITVDYIDYSPYAREDAEDFDTFFGRTFRCEAKEVGSIEVNLSLANMDFSDFADEVGPDDVFRGFGDD